jgi:hypothetical protein
VIEQTAIAGHAVFRGAAVRLCIVALFLLTASATAETFSAAPLPTDEQEEPSAPAAQSDIQLRPTFFTPTAPNFSDGFLPGSSSEDTDEEDTRGTPGVDLSVPLQ